MQTTVPPPAPRRGDSTRPDGNAPGAQGLISGGADRPGERTGDDAADCHCRDRLGGVAERSMSWLGRRLVVARIRPLRWPKPFALPPLRVAEPRCMARWACSWGCALTSRMRFIGYE